MASLLERKLIVVTGKGGVGKTTVACALGLVGARRGLRTIVVEVGDQHRLPGIFGAPAVEEMELRECLWSTSIDPDRAMIEWLGSLTGRLPARMLGASSTFQYFAAAAPGGKELVTMRKLLELCDSSRLRAAPEGAPQRYDLVVLDAPATGHALGMLRSPHTFSAIARVGPMAEQARRVQEMLEGPQRSAYVAVAHPTEMAVTETLELEEQLRRLLDRDLDAVFVNGVLPQRFTREEMGLLDQVDGGDPTVSAAVGSARAVYTRARHQRAQLARLRRQRFAGGAAPGVLTVPFQFAAQLDLTGIEAIAERLRRSLR